LLASTGRRRRATIPDTKQSKLKKPTNTVILILQIQIKNSEEECIYVPDIVTVRD